jgi:uncharacterized protein
MNRNELIIITEEFVRENLKGYDSGHDWWHIERVRGLARHINMMESLAEPFIVEMTALLHDSADSKFSGENNEAGYARIAEFMERPGLFEIKNRVIQVIRNISFSKKDQSGDMSDPLLHVIQDADRLDAIGAVGIARAFNYGGFRNNKIYNPGDESGGRSTIGHFYEKLLLLKDKMNTDTARKLAADRHEFLEAFLDRFYNEWDFAIE